MSLSGREYLQHILDEADYLLRSSRGLTEEGLSREPGSSSGVHQSTDPSPRNVRRGRTHLDLCARIGRSGTARTLMTLFGQVSAGHQRG